MNRLISVCALACALQAGLALAQTAPPTNSPPGNTSSSSRSDARYPHPAGQDAAPVQKKPPKPPAPATPGTVDQRGTQTRNQSPPVREAVHRKAYTTGSKPDPGTACSTARPTKNGGVDCGTSGTGATVGRTVTKPH